MQRASRRGRKREGNTVVGEKREEERKLRRILEKIFVEGKDTARYHHISLKKDRLQVDRGTILDDNTSRLLLESLYTLHK